MSDAPDSLELVVFDLDGTLVDSRRDLADSANVLIREHGGTPQDVVTLGRMVGHGAAALVRRALDAAGVRPRPPDALDRFLEIYSDRLLDHTRPYPGIPEVVGTLHGRVPLAVLTNKPGDASVRILEGLELADAFDAIVGGDGPHPRKPDPAALQELVRASGARADSTLFVGDSIVDFQTARNAGVRACLARYGYGYLDFPEDELTGDEWLLDEPLDLLALLDPSAPGSGDTPPSRGGRRDASAS